MDPLPVLLHLPDDALLLTLLVASLMVAFAAGILASRAFGPRPSKENLACGNGPGGEGSLKPPLPQRKQQQQRQSTPEPEDVSSSRASRDNSTVLYNTNLDGAEFASASTPASLRGPSTPSIEGRSSSILSVDADVQSLDSTTTADAAVHGNPAAASEALDSTPSAAAAISHPTHVWYITARDLEFFRLRAERDVQVPGAGPWSHMFEREAVGRYRYAAWRRSLPRGRTEYRSLMLLPDCSPLELVDFSFDDNYRARWEGFMVSMEVMEAGDQRQKQQVVRWIRSSPFGFLTDRSYVLARALYSVTSDGIIHSGLPSPRPTANTDAGVDEPVPLADLYCIVKSIDHPGGHDGIYGKVVQISDYYSMWRCRAVKCPWGGGRPAVEVLLLHSEDMKIPERLARMACSLGMSRYIQTMAGAVPGFVAERRRRCAPMQPDPLAYGHHRYVFGAAAIGGGGASAMASTLRGGGGESPPLVPPTERTVAPCGSGGGRHSTASRAAPLAVADGARAGTASRRTSLSPQSDTRAGDTSDGDAAGRTGGGSVPPDGRAPAPAGGDGGGWDSAADPWASVTASGVWHPQALPDRWGAGGNARGNGGGGAGRLLRRVAIAAVLLLLVRSKRPAGGAGAQSSRRRGAGGSAPAVPGEGYPAGGADGGFVQ